MTPTIVWIKDSVNTSLVSDDLNTIVPSVLSNISDTLYSLSIFSSSHNTSDAGQYTCQATITVTEINVTIIKAILLDLPLQSNYIWYSFDLTLIRQVVLLYHCRNQLDNYILIN